jgi:hypothetical protein
MIGRKKRKYFIGNHGIEAEDLEATAYWPEPAAASEACSEGSK